MKFIRKSKARERVIDFLAKSMLIAFSALVCLWMISGARAGSAAEIVDIRQQELEGGNYAVDFLFSKPLNKGDVAVEFQRNFIQLTLKGISAYPARTTKLNHAAMEKVFTYQYQPDVTRARMLLKGQASAIQAFTTSEVEAQRVRILVKAGAVAKGADAVKNHAAAAEAPLDPEEELLRKEIVAGQGAVAASAAAVTTAAAAATSTNAKGSSATASAPAATAAKNEKPVDKESLPVFSTRDGATAEKKEGTGAGTRMLTSLLLVIGLIAGGTLAFRKFAATKGINLNLPFQKQSRLIEVVSTTSVGGKRSIAIVKVMDQYLVVGMGDGNMSLLKDLGANSTLDKHLEETNVGIGPSFSNTFQGVLSGAQGAAGASSRDVGATKAASARAAINAAASAADGIVPGVSASAGEGIRSSIKKRLEGFKPL